MKLYLEENNIKNLPWLCGLVDQVSACKPKGLWFDSQSGHMPGLPARSWIGSVQEATNLCISCTSMFLSFFLPPFLSL